MKNLRELHEAGLLKTIEDAAEAEKGKTGVLRGGNAGFIMNGKPASSCQRKAYLRMHGVQLEETTPVKQLMFDGGLASEDYFVEHVKKMWPHEVKCEEDVPSVWTTKSGIQVTGRPDLVLFGPDGKPLKVGEKKGIFSLWTARDILERRPKLVNMAQLTQYMMSLDIPLGELIYVNRTFFASNDMAARVLPKPGTKYSEHMDYRYYEWRPQKRDASKWTRGRISKEEFEAGDKSEVIRVRAWNSDNYEYEERREMRYSWEHGNIQQFSLSFELRDVDGKIEWRDTSSERERWQASPITYDGIRTWYEQTADMDSTQKLPPPPTNPKLGGKKDGYSLCAYCPLQKFCETKPRTVDEFREGAKKFLTSTSEVS